MAQKYPHVSVLGVDLAPTPFEQPLLPANLSFEVYDVNKGLGRYHDQFDIIHMRSAMTGIWDIDKTVEDIQLCLKPGGLVILLCADTRIYGEDRLHSVKIPDPTKEGPDSEGSWFHKIIHGNCNYYTVFQLYIIKPFL